MVRRLIAGLALSLARCLSLCLPLCLAAAGPLAAQDGRVWVQVEAVPTLGRAQGSAERYSARFEDVEGYYLGGGWYGVAIGPFARAEAEALLDRLVAEGAVPRDSFLSDGAGYRERFWPAGSAAAASAAADPLLETAAEIAPAPDLAPAMAPDPTLPDESPDAARDGEAALSPEAKKLLQVALQWAGVYDGAIDGAYGGGTRAAMAAWQSQNGLDATGVLTTRQRAALLAAYNAILAGLDLRLVEDAETGIALKVPLGVVAFAAYEPPFARFDPSQEFPAQVLLISQAGDQDRLWGLYEILQTLAIVPPEGPRERTETGFVIEGADAEVHSTIVASLEDGEIKGFALVWPAGDEERRARLFAEMRATFARRPGVLSPGAGDPGEDQGVDLVSGLEVRRPRQTASGFYVDGLGTVVTSAEAVASCDHVTLDEVHRARVGTLDARLGLAILEPEEALAPRAVAAFQTAVPRIGAEVAVAGYPYGGVLSQPALTFGRLADIRGLGGEGEVKRLVLAAQPGDAGGPVFDGGGAVLGMLLPRAATDGQVLPPDVSYALDAETILAALARAGIEAATTDEVGAVPPERLTREAAGLTVLVSCW